MVPSDGDLLIESSGFSVSMSAFTSNLPDGRSSRLETKSAEFSLSTSDDAWSDHVLLTPLMSSLSSDESGCLGDVFIGVAITCWLATLSGGSEWQLLTVVVPD